MAPSSAQHQHQTPQFRFYQARGQDPKPHFGFRFPDWGDETSDAFKEKGSDGTVYRTQLLLQQWYNYVGDYLRRRLTVPSDRLPAISAIAQDMQEKLNFSYYAGIWLQDAPVGLAWVTDGLASSVPTWRAPSWSWAALNFQPEIFTYRSFQSSHHKWHFAKEDSALKSAHHNVDSNVHRLLAQPAPLYVEGNILHYENWPKSVEITQLISTRFSRTHLLCEFDCQREGKPYVPDDLYDLLLLRLGTWYDQNLHVREKNFQRIKENEKIQKQREARKLASGGRDDPSDFLWASLNPYVTVPRRFAYALMLRESVNGQYIRVGIAKVPDSEEWWTLGWEWNQVTLI